MRDRGSDRSKKAPEGGKARRVKRPDCESVRIEWGRRVESEYRSATLAQHLTLWLMQMGSPPPLVRAGLNVVKDEIAHAEVSYRVYAAAGGDALPPVRRESLSLWRNPTEPLEAAVGRACVELFCLGDTLAVAIYRELRDASSVPSAQKAIDRILRDEMHHRDYGWALLRYLLSMPSGPAVRAIIARDLPMLLAKVRRSYMPPGARAIVKVSPEERAWGLMPIARYGEILERTVLQDYRPRFREFEIDASAAWQRAIMASFEPSPE